MASAQTLADRAPALRDAALQGDTVAWDLLEGLTTEVGQRLAGTEAEARGRAWAVRRLTALGFANVHVEPFDMPVWVRGEEHAEIVSPFPQRMVLTALGNSGATPPEGITGEIVAFNSVAELEAAPDAAVRGRIVFIDHHMMPTQDGSGYGQFGAPRRQGPTIASRKGAVAIVVRSIGTDHHRNPHTGVQTFGAGARPIPAAALTIPDAEQLQRILARGQPVRMHLVLTPRNTGTHQSGNIIADVPGSDPAAGMIVIGGHLDSWDLGTGAMDDGMGVTAAMGAVAVLKSLGLAPRRTLRVVAWMNEENGTRGSKAYFASVKDSLATQIAAIESDFGLGRPLGVRAPVDAATGDRLEPVLAALRPIGAGVLDRRPAEMGSDIEPLQEAGVAAFSPLVDGRRYFDLHHSPADTFDKVDADALRRQVAVLAVLAYFLAEVEEPLRATRTK
jgi:hypothetical protein